MGNDKEFGQEIAVFFQRHGIHRGVGRGGERDGGVEGFAEFAGGAVRLDGFVDEGADFQEHGDIGFDVGTRPVGGSDGPILEVHGIGDVFNFRGRVGPGFVAREREDGREQTHEGVEDVMDRGLRRAAQRRVGAERVEAVLEDVVVDRRERDGAELVAELVDAVELVGVVGFGALA
jgi:hypothetical protein